MAVETDNGGADKVASNRGKFLQFKGTPIFENIDRIVPMRVAEAPQVITRVFDGSLIPWTSGQAAQKTHAQVIDPSSLYHRALAAVLDYPESKESKAIFADLNDQVNSFQPTAIISAPGRLAEWWYKLVLLGEAYSMIHQKSIFEEQAFGETAIPVHMQTFATDLETRMDQVENVIDGLSNEQLLWFLPFHSLVRSMYEIDLKPIRKTEMRFRRRGSEIPKELYNIMSNAYSEGSDKWRMDLLYLKVEARLDHKWNEMQVDWDWRKIADVVNLLPLIGSQATKARAIDAIEDNLEAGQAGEIHPQQLSQEGVLTLLHFDIPKNIDPLTTASFAADLDETELARPIQFTDISLPIRLAPVTTVRLITVLASFATEGALGDLLARAQTAVFHKNSKASATAGEWLLLLALLHDSSDKIVRERIVDFISSTDFPHQTFRDVLLNKRAGKIGLLDNGDIRVTNGTLFKAHLIHSSSFVTPEKPVVPVAKTSQRAIQAPPYHPQRDTTTVRPREVRRQPPAPLTPIKKVLAESMGSETSVNQRSGSILVLPSGQTLANVCQKSGILPQDLAGVEQAIEDHQQFGRHPLEPLRARTTDGQTIWKMRLNGHTGQGIRIRCFHTGNGKYQIESIKYRGKAYEDL